MFGKNVICCLLLLCLSSAPQALWGKVSKDEPTSEPPARADVVIAGAGLSGLLSAYFLKDKNVIILEGSERVGGRVASSEHTVEGEIIRVNTGMEEFWQSNPLVDVIQMLGLKVITHNAASSMILNGKLYAYHANETKSEFIARSFGQPILDDLNAIEEHMIQILGAIKNARHLPQEIYALKDISFAQWIAGHKPGPLLSEWMRQTLEPEIGSSWSNISALDGLIEYSIFLKDGQKAFQIVGGNENLTDKLADEVGRDRIFTRYRLQKVESLSGQVRLTVQDMRTGEQKIVYTENFVNTIPLPEVMKHVTFSPALPIDQQLAAKSLEGGSYHKVNVFLDSGGAKFFLNERNASVLPILTDSPLGVIYNGNTLPSQSIRALTLLVYGKHAKTFTHLSSAEREAYILAELEKLFPGISQHVLSLRFLQKPEKSIAAWGVGRSRLDKLSNSMREMTNGIYFAGDFTESSHSDGAIRSALRVSRQIREGNLPLVLLPSMSMTCGEVFTH